MIVQCPQCRARFRVADEKVPERGVKVRCTKCANVFRVTRGDAVDQKPAARDELGLGLDTPSPRSAPTPAPRTSPTPAPLGSFGAPAPRPAPSRTPMPPPRAPAADPFADLLPKAGAPASADPFAELDYSAPPPRPSAPAAYVPAPPPNAAAVADPFADGLDAPPPAPALSAAPPPDPFAVGPSRLDETDPFAGVENSLGPAAAPFASKRESTMPPPPPAPAPALDDLADLGGSGSRTLSFDDDPGGLDLASPGLPPVAPTSAPVPVELGRFSMGDSKADPELDPATAARLQRRRQVASAVVNVGAALAIGLTGLVTAAVLRAPRPLTWDDAGFNVVWLALGAGDPSAEEPLVATDVKTGTYVTRGGRELFYVTGRAVNASSVARSAVRVQVELRHGDDTLARAESLAALDGGPEELYDLDSGGNDELERELAKTTPNVHLEPRQSAPFIAVFPLSSSQVEGAKVQLTVADGVPVALQDAYPARAPAPVATPKATPVPATAPAKAPPPAGAKP